MIRGRLFTRYWLEEGIQGTEEYRALHVDTVGAFMAEAARLWGQLGRMATPSEAETESELVHPLLDSLGWHRLPQQTPGRGRRDIADELLFTTEKAKSAAQRLADKAARFRHGAVVVENEARHTLLDRAKGSAEAPSNQILRT